MLSRREGGFVLSRRSYPLTLLLLFGMIAKMWLGKQAVSAEEKSRTALRRVGIIATLLLAILLAPLSSKAQPTKVPRIGWLSESYVRSEQSPRHEAFLEGLRELGYTEGQNIIIEYRSAGGKDGRLPGLANELVRLKVDVIVALEPPVVRAVKNATRTIPIVMRSTDDPVAIGLVASLARPGGNITGVASVSAELTGKRLELLKEIVPRLARVAVLWNPDYPSSSRISKEAEAAARDLNVQLQSLEVRDPNDFAPAFEAATREHAGALIALRNPLIVIHRSRVTTLANKSRLPAIYDDREFVEAAGLASYGANLADLYRRAATYVDKILKGAKPGDLPVEQPTKFELFINLKTAKKIGLTIPPEVLMRADQVIR